MEGEISAAAASVVFMFIFHGSLGILNRVLGTNIGWLTDTRHIWKKTRTLQLLSTS